MGSNPSHPVTEIPKRPVTTIAALTSVEESRVIGQKLSSFNDSDIILWLIDSNIVRCCTLDGFTVDSLILPSEFNDDPSYWHDGGIAIRLVGPPTIYYIIYNEKLHKIYNDDSGQRVEVIDCEVIINYRCKIFQHAGNFYISSGREKYDLRWELHCFDSDWRLLKTIELPNTCYKVVGFTHIEHVISEIIFSCLEGLSYYNLASGKVVIRRLTRRKYPYLRDYKVVEQVAYGSVLPDDEDLLRSGELSPVLSLSQHSLADSPTGSPARGSFIFPFRSKLRSSATGDTTPQQIFAAAASSDNLHHSLSAPTSDEHLNSQTLADPRALSVDSHVFSRTHIKRASREIIVTPAYLISLLSSVDKEQPGAVVLVDCLHKKQQDMIVSTLHGDSAVHALTLSSNEIVYIYGDDHYLTWRELDE